MGVGVVVEGVGLGLGVFAELHASTSAVAARGMLRFMNCAPQVSRGGGDPFMIRNGPRDVNAEQSGYPAPPAMTSYLVSVTAICTESNVPVPTRWLPFTTQSMLRTNVSAP